METKSTLKQARECIDKKDFKEALRLCKGLLKEDKKNYNAWIIFGLAASQTNDNVQHAEPAYRNAIQLEPTNLLAWRGLSDLFSKTNDREKAVDVYKELIKLYGTDEKKSREFVVKLAETYTSLKNRKDAIETWGNLLNFAGNTDDQIYDIWKKIVSLKEKEESDFVNKEIENRLNKLKVQQKKAGANVVVAKAPLQPVPYVPGTISSGVPEDPDAQVKKELEQQIQDEILLKSNEMDDLYIKIKNLSCCNIPDYQVKYIQRLLRRRKLLPEHSEKLRVQIIEECLNLRKKHPHSYFSYETLLYLQEEDIAEVTSMKERRDLYQRLFHLNPERGMSNVGLGILLADINYKKSKDRNQLANMNEDARAFVSKGLKTQSDILEGWISLAEMLLENLSLQSTIECVNKALKCIETRSRDSNTSFTKCTLRLLLILAKAYYKSNKKTLAIETFNEILKTDKSNLEALKGLAEIEFEDKNYSQAQKYVDLIFNLNPKNDWALAQLGYLHFLQNQLEEAKTRLLEALSINKDVAIYNYWLGIVYWKMGGEFQSNKKYAQTQFLISAKLDPTFASNFTYLGHFYRLVEKDLERAKKCYQKALSLDQLDEEAGIALSDLYIEHHQHSLAVAIYREVTSRSTRIKWAWMRLSLYQLSKNNFDEAVIGFQTTLRQDPKDSVCWQGLAETYKRQGKYTAALKAFQRAVELNPDLVYSQYQAAAMQQMLGLELDSIAQFEKALKQTPNYLPALKGLGEAHFSLAKDQLRRGLYYRTANNLEKAIEAFEGCTKLQGDLTCIWKLLGDSYTYYYFLPSNLASKKQDKTIDFEKEVDSKSKLSKLESGEQAYLNAVQVNPTLASLSFDLGVNYYYQAMSLENVKDVDANMKKAVEAVKKAIHIGSDSAMDNALFWNALGILEKEPTQQQHCFIKSLHYDSKNITAWNNLGILYLKYGKFNLAHQAFNASLSQSPNQSLAWLGEALIHEYSSRPDALQQARTFYKGAASQAIEHQPLAQLGLGYVSIISDDYHTARDALRKYVEVVPMDSAGHNMYGLALESIGLLKAAEREFANALSLINKETENANADKTKSMMNNSVSFTSIVPKSIKLRAASINHARVLSSLGLDDKAIEENLKQESVSDPEIWSYLGLSYLHKQDYENSLKAFEKALEISSEENKKDVLLCLVQLHYIQNNVDKAKILVAQCVKKYPDFARGWETMCALALAIGDFKVADHALRKLRQIESALHSSQLYILTFHFYVLQDNYPQARNALFKGIHQFPTNLSLWNKLSALLLERENSSTLLSNLARNLNSRLCNQTPPTSTLDTSRSIKSSSSGTNYESILSQEQTIIRLNEFSKLSLQFGKYTPQFTSQNSMKQSLLAIQQSLRMNPTNTESWYLLAVTSYIYAIVAKKSHLWRAAEKAIQLALFKYQQSEAIDDFAVGFLQVAWADCLLDEGKYKQALDHLNKFTQDEYFVATTPLLAVLYRQIARTLVAMNAKKEEVLKAYQQSLAANPLDCISWIELAYYSDSKMGLSAAVKCFEQCAQLQGEAPVELYLVLTQYAHYLIQNRCFEEAVPIITQALDIQPDSPTALFLRGLLYWKAQDIANAEEHFQRSLMMDPSQPLVNYYLSLVHIHVKDLETADSDLHYEQDNYRLSDATLYQFGKIAGLNKKSDVAKSYLQRAIHMNPTNDVYWKELDKYKK